MGLKRQSWPRRTRNFAVEHRVPVGLAGCAIATGVAVLYLVVIPGEGKAATGLVGVVLAYGHAACWFLLAVVCALFAFERASRARRALAWSALAVYAVFILTLALTGPGPS